MAVDQSSSPHLGVLKFFARYIEQNIGIIYSETNYFQLEHRLNDIVTLQSLSGLDELFERAQSGINGQFRDLLLDVATNNETSFFRDSRVFDELIQSIIPSLKSNSAHFSRPAQIHFWSAAGSTGQEAYSIAMAMDQARLLDQTFPDFDIFVSDISSRVLERSKQGLYTQLEVQRGLPKKLLINYFENEGETSWRVKSLLRAKLRFNKLNLLEPIPPSIGIFDIVFCRNVLIYQSIENKKEVVERLLKQIAPKGYLILGAAESMLGVSTAVKQVQFGSVVVYQKI